MSSMFEILMNLPLFRGVSHEKLAQVVGEAKFHFLKYPAGEPVVREGESCTHIAFVIRARYAQLLKTLQAASQ